jgi:hypothetical protein
MGTDAATHDVKQAKPMEVKGGQVVEGSLRLGKIP